MRLQYKWLLCGFDTCLADTDYINLLWANPKSEGSLSSQLVLVKRIGLRLASLCGGLCHLIVLPLAHLQQSLSAWQTKGPQVARK